jgi:hypothetical protein
MNDNQRTVTPQSNMMTLRAISQVTSCFMAWLISYSRM